MTLKNSRRVLVFGTFDGLDNGHKFFLQKAKTKGTHLVVAVARDKHVRELKMKSPFDYEVKRLRKVSELKIVDEAYLSDEELGTFEIIEKAEPDIVVLGFDQTELEDSLRQWSISQDTYLPLLRIKKM
jgi:cytidyltransferase-like protein